MRTKEKNFLKDIEEAIEQWSADVDYEHDNGCFCVDVTIDMEDWGSDSDEIWDALSDVADEWGAGIDSDCNTYYLALEL